MTIERKVKYVASDGTEHDSPQEAATHNLRSAICRASGLPRAQADTTARYLADNPEALRNAVNAYFEALEEHPDVSPEPPHPSGLELTGVARRTLPGATVHDWLAKGWTREDLIEDGYAVCTLTEGEVAPGVRGFEMVVPAGSELPSYRGTCSGDHLAPACADPQCWLREPRRE